MRTTFYIAGSDANQAQVDLLADYLVARGLRWLNENDLDSGQSLQCARSADLFILLLLDELIPMAYTALGARWASGKEIHVIQTEADGHLVHELPGVISHTDMETFVSRTLVP